MEEKTLNDFTKQSKEWEKKVHDELAIPYGIFAKGTTA